MRDMDLKNHRLSVALARTGVCMAAVPILFLAMIGLVFLLDAPPFRMILKQAEGGRSSVMFIQRRPQSLSDRIFRRNYVRTSDGGDIDRADYEK